MESARSGGVAADARERGVLVSRSCEVPDVSFRAFLTERAVPRIHWSAPDGLEVAGGGAAVRLRASGPDRFETLRTGARAVFADVDHDGPRATRPRMLGGLAFTDDHDATGPWTGFPAAGFSLPAAQLTRTSESTYLTVSRFGPDVDPERVEAELERVREDVATLPAMVPSGDPPGVRATRHRTDAAEWQAGVSEAAARIREGALRKVVLALALDVDLAGEVDVPSVLERLRRTYPQCYRFLVQPAETAGFFGAPPERLVRLTGRHVETEALAGSAARGDTPEEDADLAAALVESEKIQHEQGLVAETIRDLLAPLGEVTVGDQEVHRLATIQHLRTPITADLAADEHVLSIVEALHPTPAVGGLPPDVAERTIRETETFERGWYAGPVGWFDADGDGEFAVGIRSGVAGDRRATLFAGNGIVGDSDPEDEWDEVRLKYRPILDELERTGE
ncbi:isochorismate synthase [Halomarina ordinaria]|uniref:isochorismate synthase n=1 Tax=Halomarina ordinaria TaxID=3033939 RepID=A0ABD5U9L5_9EURY|nr:isochorismate synthase [Halomarina sp. PSRA2]